MRAPVICLLFLSLLLLVGGSEALGQIMAVYPKEAYASKYKRYLRDVRGRPAIIGEIKSGLILNGNNISPQKQNELYIPNLSDPKSVPYRFKNGERVSIKPKQVVKIPGAHVGKTIFFMRDFTLSGLANEYEIRQTEIDSIRKKRDKQKRGSKEWFEDHVKFVGTLERLELWLANTLFPRAATRIKKDIARQKKSVRESAAKDGEKAALASIHSVPTPEALLEAAEEITGGKAEFKVQESAHIRITYLSSEISEEKARGLLRLAETVISGFRAKYVYPYIGEGFRDFIPDRIFHEFWFGPSYQPHREKLYEQYYNQKWGKRHDQPRKGRRGQVGRKLTWLDYWNVDEVDHEAVVTHGIGHSLATYHFNEGGRITQPWLAEATGYDLSFGYLGRNSVNCFQRKIARYGSTAQKKTEREAKVSLRGYLNGLALEKGPRIDALARKKLYEMEDPDLAKAWSLLDFIIRTKGKAGQLWLRAACKAGGDINKWTTKSEEIFSTTDEGILATIDEEWKNFARDEQELGNRTK